MKKLKAYWKKIDNDIDRLSAWIFQKKEARKNKKDDREQWEKDVDYMAKKDWKESEDRMKKQHPVMWLINKRISPVAFWLGVVFFFIDPILQRNGQEGWALLGRLFTGWMIGTAIANWFLEKKHDQMYWWINAFWRNRLDNFVESILKAKVEVEIMNLEQDERSPFKKRRAD